MSIALGAILLWMSVLALVSAAVMWGDYCDR